MGLTIFRREFVVRRFGKEEIVDGYGTAPYKDTVEVLNVQPLSADEPPVIRDLAGLEADEHPLAPQLLQLRVEPAALRGQPQALALLTAHRLKMAGYGDSSYGTVGDTLRIGSYSEGETSIGFTVNQATNLLVDAELTLTPYGLEYLSLRPGRRGAPSPHPG